MPFRFRDFCISFSVYCACVVQYREICLHVSVEWSFCRYSTDLSAEFAGNQGSDICQHEISGRLLCSVMLFYNFLCIYIYVFIIKKYIHMLNDTISYCLLVRIPTNSSNTVSISFSISSKRNNTFQEEVMRSIHDQYQHPTFTCHKDPYWISAFFRFSGKHELFLTAV